MNRDEIIKMAREAGIDVQEGYVAYCDIDDLVCFFHMAQAAEREACAKLCEEPGWNAANWCAQQIRARGQT